MTTAPAQRIAAFFESFEPRHLPHLAGWYCEDAHFRDPFNDVRGLDAIRRVYAHMFETAGQPRFQVLHTTAVAGECWMTWNFSFGAGKPRRTIHGASYLKLAPDGRIAVHRDYWDTAGELYEQVPVLGALMRMARRRLRAPQA